LDGESLSISDDMSDPSVIYAAKRLIGRSFTDEERAQLAETFHFGIAFDESGRPTIQVEGGESHSPVQILSSVLAAVRGNMRRKLRVDIVNAVIAVPAFFSNNQRRAVFDAASIAGFKSVQLVSDAVAVLLATRSARPASEDDRTLVLVDFGAGKLDLSIVKETTTQFTMYRTTGSTNFGGLDFDAKLYSELAKGASLDDIGRRRLFCECDRVRVALSEHDEASISMAELGSNVTVSAAKLTEMFAGLYSQISTSLGQLFEGEEALLDQIDEVLIAGGLSKDPRVIQIIRDYFAGRPTFTVCPDNTVVVGATLQGARQAALWPEAVPDVRIRMTIPRSIGFSLNNGGNQVLIRRGTILPTTKSMTTTTYRNNQRKVVFNVVEGESATATGNIVLGRITVTGIEKAPKGVPHIVITMNIDVNGLLTVHASDQSTGAEISTKLQSCPNLSQTEMEEIIALTQAVEERIRKRDAWKSRLTRYLQKLRATTVARRYRAQFERLLDKLEEWIWTHEGEQDPDVYVKKCFEMRELAKPFLPAS
jgi:molecular chaperone DnaK (HSP70)